MNGWISRLMYTVYLFLLSTPEPAALLGKSIFDCVVRYCNILLTLSDIVLWDFFVNVILSFSVSGIFLVSVLFFFFLSKGLTVKVF